MSTETKRTIRKYVPTREDVIRVEVIELPTQKLRGEGLYEWRFMDDKQLMDIMTLEKELEERFPGKSEQLLDRLQNFRKIFMNLTTGEVSS